MKTFISFATLLIVVAAFTIAWRQANSARAAHATLTEIATAQSKLRAEIESAQQRVTLAKHDAAELESALTELSRKPAPAVPKKTAPALPPLNGAEVAKLVDASPELHSLFRESTRAGISAHYRTLYAAANLTPDQVKKFEDVMLEDAEEKMDLAAVMQKQGVSPKDPAVQKMREESEAKLVAGQQAALGDAGYKQLQELTRTQAADNFILNVASLVMDRAAPLTESQAVQLRAVIANTSPVYRAGGKLDPANVDWARVLTDAQPFLSPSQLTALRAQAQMPAVFELMKQFYQQQGAATGK